MNNHIIAIDAILSLLNDEGRVCSTKEIIERSGLARRTVNHALKRLMNNNLVESPAHGCFAVQECILYFKVKPNTIIELVLDILENGGLWSVKELTLELNMTYIQVQNALYNLYKKGIVCRHSRGIWSMNGFTSSMLTKPKREHVKGNPLLMYPWFRNPLYTWGERMR